LSSGVSFGGSGYAGSAELDSLHTIHFGPDGFSGGTLSLVNFYKPGGDSLQLETSGSSGITLGPGTTIGGSFKSTSAAITLNGCNFYGLTNIIKTGSSNDLGSGRNIFYRNTEIINNGAGSFTMANTNPDTFTAMFH
jgi:hypothetical protein